MPQHYIRLGILPLEPVLAAIRRRMDNPELPKEATFLDTVVKISGVRLQTFASHPQLCCSDPNCGLRATHFAVERSGQPAQVNGQNHPQYHLNLYGLDSQGQEVLMTHDHTLARGLGGADDLSNTTIMCSPCNGRKAKLESRACHRRPSNLMAAMEEDVSARRVERTLDHMQRMAQRMDVSLDAYRAHCEAEALLRPDMGHTTLANRPARVKLARKIGLSVAALSFFKHEHNGYEMAQRRIGKPGAILGGVANGTEVAGEIKTAKGHRVHRP